jgi:hypothetical protein
MKKGLQCALIAEVTHAEVAKKQNLPPQVLFHAVPFNDYGHSAMARNTHPCRWSRSEAIDPVLWLRPI